MTAILQMTSANAFSNALSQILEKFVSMGPINNTSVLFEIMAWCWTMMAWYSDPFIKNAALMIPIL